VRKKPKDKPGSAYEKALSLLVRREHSKRELKTKLSQRGFDKVESSAAVEVLQDKNFQSDERFAEILVRRRIADGYGPRRIAAELKSHALSDARARTLLAAADPDWNGIARVQLRRRYGGRVAEDRIERGKRAQFLLRRGFDAATVRTVTRAEDVDESDPPFD
jgi:regulatory protein